MKNENHTFRTFWKLLKADSCTSKIDGATLISEDEGCASIFFFRLIKVLLEQNKESCWIVKTTACHVQVQQFFRRKKLEEFLSRNTLRALIFIYNNTHYILKYIQNI